ncbi:hypothetical protein F5Y10DRAFT_228297 [Nemania abortiva]|nr:hypothetical protein F5Y10DRAFT_228297 [Nemania abortiva]
MSLTSIVHGGDNQIGQTSDLQTTTLPRTSKKPITIMEFKRRDMIMEIPRDILLCIVEKMDTVTRRCFMAASKGIRNTCERYEHSISKSRVATFTMPPLGNALSSATDERHVLAKNTFSMVIELELRQVRIERLLEECPKIFCFATPPWLPPLTPRQQARLEGVVKRALYQCDRIADIAANEPCVTIPMKYYHAIPDNVYELPSAITSPSDDLYKLNPLTRPDARQKQIKYIRSLPLEDITGIFIAIEMIGHGLMCRTPVRPSPERFERKTIIEECILRHGTWFVWARLLGGPDLQDLASSMVRAGKVEAALWESGEIHQPRGLKMTLLAWFKELADRDDVPTWTKVSDCIVELVLQGEEARTGWEDDSDEDEDEEEEM